jgi:hypothetical protein
MSDLTPQDYSELIRYYKNKVADLELQYLVLQINNKKDFASKIQEHEKNLNDKFQKELGLAHTRIESLEKTIIKLNKIESSKNKKKK